MSYPAETLATPDQPGLYRVCWPNACPCCVETERKAAQVIASDVGLLVKESEYMEGWVPVGHYHFDGAEWTRLDNGGVPH